MRYTRLEELCFICNFSRIVFDISIQSYPNLCRGLGSFYGTFFSDDISDILGQFSNFPEKRESRFIHQIRKCMKLRLKKHRIRGMSDTSDTNQCSNQGLVGKGVGRIVVVLVREFEMYM